MSSSSYFSGYDSEEDAAIYSPQPHGGRGGGGGRRGDGGTGGSPPSVSSPGSKILIRRPPNWYQTYFIRLNRGGSFCMYPDLGGPFQSVGEAKGAISRHIDELCRPAMCKEQSITSVVDRLVYKSMHYADGTPKRGPNSRKVKNTECEQHYLAQALVDQYNDDHNLLGVLAHELESLVKHEWIYENDTWFYHLNFATKTKGANGTVSSSNLFFAEVSHLQGETDAWEINCCCMINSKDNGHCYGCKNNGSPEMQHPSDTGAYIGGHLDEYLPFGGDELSGPEDEEAVEGRLRHIYEGLDDSSFWERIYSYVDRPR
ncbi:unnamed protein product [Urochloa humidicola]